MKKSAPSPLGEQLRAAREASGMTSAAVARALGHEGADAQVAATILAYESGRRRPNEETLLRLAALYRRTLEYVRIDSELGRVIVRAEPKV